jgi:hypothetical protein
MYTKTFAKFAVTIILASLFSPFSLANAKDGKPLDAFFAELYQNNVSDFKKAYGKGYLSFCEDYNINSDDPANQEKYFKLLFYNKMLTTTNSVDCTKGGMLKIPYFWHWIDPNPRHRIIDNESGTLLVDKSPPERYSLYKSHADIDRTPYIYLKDLVSEKPGYRHPDCSEFYTFGWCSEREMAYSLLIGLYGFKSKIVQKGIHVTSNVWVTFTTRSGKKATLMAIVDNTYDVLVWKKVKRIAFDSWYKDMGTIKMVKWYNKKARSEEERELVKDIRVGEKAAARIEGLVD